MITISLVFFTVFNFFSSYATVLFQIQCFLRFSRLRELLHGHFPAYADSIAHYPQRFHNHFFFYFSLSTSYPTLSTSFSFVFHIRIFLQFLLFLNFIHNMWIIWWISSVDFDCGQLFFIHSLNVDKYFTLKKRWI